jgi:3-oxoacyl-[acyl-carrier-protein] synthase III
MKAQISQGVRFIGSRHIAKHLEVTAAFVLGAAWQAIAAIDSENARIERIIAAVGRPYKNYAKDRKCWPIYIDL